MKDLSSQGDSTGKPGGRLLYPQTRTAQMDGEDGTRRYRDGARAGAGQQEDAAGPEEPKASWVS